MKRFEAVFGGQVFTRYTNRDYKYAISWREADGTFAKPSFCARKDLALKVKCPAGRERQVVECKPSTKRIARTDRNGKIDVHFYLDADQYDLLVALSVELGNKPIAKICREAVMKEIDDPLSLLL